MTGQQSLKTVVMTDVAGFTEIMRENEPQTLPMLRADMEVIRAHVGRQGGEVVKVVGDGLLALFDSAPSAVRACIDAQDELTGSTLKHRMAIHAGEVTVSESDAYGDAINICARIEAATTPGSVYASQIIIDLVKAQGLPNPASIGKIQLKGIDVPVQVYSWGDSSKAPTKRKKGILVAVIATICIAGGSAYAFWPKPHPVSGKKRTNGQFGFRQRIRESIYLADKARQQAENSGSNPELDSAIDDALDQAYDELLVELEEFENKKKEAVKLIDAKIVLNWLHANPIGGRDRGRLEIEHWSLIEIAIEAGRTKAGKNATADQIWSVLDKSKDPDLEIAKKAFAEEFRSSK